LIEEAKGLIVAHVHESFLCLATQLACLFAALLFADVFLNLSQQAVRLSVLSIDAENL